MTRAEVAAYDAGVTDVLDIALKAAERITKADRRQVHVGFAAEALAELATAGRALLIGKDGSGPTSPQGGRNPPLNASTGGAAHVG